MSFQSIDSDDFAIFSNGSCSPGVDTALPLYSNLDYVPKDDTAGQRNSAPLVNSDQSLYQTMLMSDLVSKEGASKVEHSLNETTLASPVWTFGDLLTTVTPSNHPSLLPFESVTPAVRSHTAVSWNTPGTSSVPVSVSWNTSGTSSVPVTVSWNTSGTSSVPVTVSWNKSGTSSVPVTVSWNTSGTSSVPVTVSRNTSETSPLPVTVRRNTSGTSPLPLTVRRNTSETSPVPASVSWSTLGTSCAPVTMSYGALGTISAQDVNLGGADNVLQQDDEQFSDAYDRVSFDGPQSQKSNLFAQASPRDSKRAFDLSPLPSVSRSEESRLGGFQNINKQCFEAAISEHFGRKEHLKFGQYISKVKNSKLRSGLSQVYDKLQRASPGPSPTHRKHKTEFAVSPLTSPALVKENASKDSNVTKTTFSTFTMPSIPSPLSPYSARSHSPVQADGQKSPKSPKGETDIKKYRYNQTALALQQSGLMKTTIKTAELLRKSRLLQQELCKLRKETAVFVHMVLNNPENKHLKDMYMPQEEDNSHLQ